MYLINPSSVSASMRITQWIYKSIVFIFIVMFTMFQQMRFRSSWGVSCQTQKPTWNFETRLLLYPRGLLARIPWSIPVLLLVCRQKWTCHLPEDCRLEGLETDAYKRCAMSPTGQFRVNLWEWRTKVLTSRCITTIMYDYLPEPI